MPTLLSPCRFPSNKRSLLFMTAPARVYHAASPGARSISPSGSTVAPPMGPTQRRSCWLLLMKAWEQACTCSGVDRDTTPPPPPPTPNWVAGPHHPLRERENRPLLQTPRNLNGLAATLPGSEARRKEGRRSAPLW